MALARCDLLRRRRGRRDGLRYGRGPHGDRYSCAARCRCWRNPRGGGLWRALGLGGGHNHGGCSGGGATGLGRRFRGGRCGCNGGRCCCLRRGGGAGAVQCDPLRRRILVRLAGAPCHRSGLIATKLFAVACNPRHPIHIAINTGANIDAAAAIDILLTCVRGRRIFRRGAGRACCLRLKRGVVDHQPGRPRDDGERDNSCKFHTCAPQYMGSEWRNLRI